MSVTLKDIAAKAGVSTITVSRAMNNKPDISETTKERILKISRDLGYIPNELAKSLVTKRSSTIGVIMPSSTDTLFIEKFESINNVCSDAGFTPIFCNTENSVDKEIEFIYQMISKRVDGILFFPSQEDERYVEILKNSSIPYVLLNRYSENLDCNYVKNDNVYGGSIVVEHLINKGYNKISYICPHPSTTTGKERILGGRQFLKDNNLPDDRFDIALCDDNINDSNKVVKSLLLSENPPDALFFWNDILALGAIKMILEMGLSIPDNIAIIGYDDLEFSQYITPGLSSVQQSTYKIGEIATNLLLNEILSPDENKEKQHIVLKPELIVRKSS